MALLAATPYHTLQRVATAPLSCRGLLGGVTNPRHKVHAVATTAPAHLFTPSDCRVPSSLPRGLWVVGCPSFITYSRLNNATFLVRATRRPGAILRPENFATATDVETKEIRAVEFPEQPRAFSVVCKMAAHEVRAGFFALSAVGRLAYGMLGRFVYLDNVERWR